MVCKSGGESDHPRGARYLPPAKEWDGLAKFRIVDFGQSLRAIVERRLERAHKLLFRVVLGQLFLRRGRRARNLSAQEVVRPCRVFHKCGKRHLSRRWFVPKLIRRHLFSRRYDVLRLALQDLSHRIRHRVHFWCAGRRWSRWLLSRRCDWHQHESHRGKYRCSHRFVSLLLNLNARIVSSVRWNKGCDRNFAFQST
jgi:hypothetical protein